MYMLKFDLKFFFSSRSSQSACEMVSLKLGPSTNKETSNPAFAGSGDANSILQHTNTAVGHQGVFTKMQKHNEHRV